MKHSTKIGNERYRLMNDGNGHIETRSLAGYEAIKLTSPNAEAAMEVLPGYGGRLNGLWLTDGGLHQNIIDGYQHNGDLLNDDSFHNAWLFPFANRLKDGWYQHKKKEYQFPRNEPNRNNALHGFLYDQPMQLEDMGHDEGCSFMTLSYHNSGQFFYYPFDLKLFVTYRLTASNSFDIQIKAKNLGAQSAPLAFGWHPFFTFNHAINDLFLKIPSQKRVEVDNRLLPTGNVIDDARFFHGRTVQDDQLDDSFELFPEKDRKISIISVPDQLKLTLSVDQAINYVQVFTPPHRRSIAIEPITSNIDAFNSGEHLRMIAPRRSFQTNYKLRLTKIK